ncbi:MAG: GNAT family N-acetyltransferase [Actinobacteria bacterium]|nr:GNAT family N-acetyltransferase [Actinomycetota bacterium]
MAYQVEVFDDPNHFLDRARGFLVREPISTNVITSVTERLASDPPAAGNRWITVSDSPTSVVGAAMLNRPWNLFVSPMPTGAVLAVAERLESEGTLLPGVTGERGATQAFAERWAETHSVTPTALVAQRAHRLGTLTPPTSVSGTARLAVADDIATLASWLEAFHDEAMPQDPLEDPTAAAIAGIENHEFWVWADDDRVASMAGCRPPAGGASRIGPVYTPPDLRGRGYAGGATAAAAAGALAAGAEHVMLYTDLSNPTSNALYARLGFVPDHDAVQIRFDRPPGPTPEPGTGDPA